jgi:hypothetical protein
MASDRLCAVLTRDRCDRQSASQKRARQEGSLSARESIHRVCPLVRVPHHEPIADQLPLDGCNRAGNMLILWRKEADRGDYQQAGVESGGSVVLSERPDV